MALNSKKAITLFSEYGLLTNIELKSKYHIWLEKYAKNIEIEAKALYDKVTTQVMPAGMKYQKELVESIAGTSAATGAKADLSLQKDFLIGVTMLISNIRSASKKMKESCEKVGSIKDERDKAEYYSNEIKSNMEAVREDVDKLKRFVNADL